MGAVGKVMAELMAVIPEEDAADLGPMMKGLPPKKRAFVYAYVNGGTAKPERAAALAGYAMGQDAANLRQTTTRLMSDPAVSAAISEEATRQYESHLLIGQAYLFEMIANPKTKNGERLRAIELAAKLGGLGQKTEHTVNVHTTNNLTVEEKLAKAIEMAKALGISDAALRRRLGFRDEQPMLTGKQIIDAEFAEDEKALVVEQATDWDNI